jgi:Zn-finger nucleic acid-binding protein
VSIYRQGPSPAGSCPRCREALTPAAPAPTMARACERCGGVFATNEASRRIVASLDRALLEVGFAASRGKPRPRGPETALGLTCPECLVSMQRIRVESAACMIDACPAHGTWFDAGELEDVMRAYARSRRAGLHPRTAPGAKATAKDVEVADDAPFAARVLAALDDA